MNRFVGLLVACCLLLVGGCATIPTSGPVDRVGESTTQQGGVSIDVEPAPPVVDGSPDLILAGFLAASASGSSSGLAVARQYLTPESAASWDPNAGVVIYDAEGHPPLVTDNSATLAAPVSGRLSAAGHFTAVTEPNFTHNFQMTQVDGQWRIANPGTGIFVSQFTFARTYRATPLYFLDRTGTRTVSENVYLHVLAWSPGGALQALLRGPSAWLRPAVTTMFPAETKTTVSSVALTEGGVAEVILGPQIDSLNADQRVQLAAQLLWTLSDFPIIRGVRIVVDGDLFPVRGQDSAGVLDLEDVRTFHPTAAGAAPAGLAALGGVLMRLPSEPARGPAPVGGPFGQADWGGQIGTMDTDPDGASVAVVTSDGDSLFTGPLDTAGTATLRVRAAGLTRPQIDRTGVTWAFAQGDGGVPELIRIQPDGQVGRTVVSDLSGASVVSFRLSTDLTRLAVVVRRGDVTEAGMLRVRGSDQQIVDGYRPLVLSTARGLMTGVRDLGWVGEGRLLVLGSTTEDSHVSSYVTDVDGALVESVGPTSDVDAIAVAAWPRAEGISAMLLTSTGHALRYEDRSRWVQVADGASAVDWAG